MLIYLLGYMGSGKSTLGKKLSTAMGYSFADLDKMIEQSENKHIPEIFEQFGEPYFRKAEQQILHKTFELKNTVIATGGGTPCFFDNMQKINSYGVSVFIDMPTKAIVDRVCNSKTKRPLLQNKTTDELISFVNEQLHERRIFYQQANVIIDGINLTTSKLFDTINSYREQHIR